MLQKLSDVTVANGVIFWYSHDRSMQNHHRRGWPIIGHQRVLHYLESSLVRRRVAQAYLFYGPTAVGKRTTAEIFLKAVLCLQPVDAFACGQCLSCSRWDQGLHPDAIILGRSSDEPALGIDKIRSLQHQLSYRPSLSTYRVALIDQADALTLEAANALLKTLEEPPAKTIIVLCAMAFDQLPPTLRSRCQQLAFQLVPQEAIEELLVKRLQNRPTARNLSHVAVGRPGLALKLLNNRSEYDRYRERVERLLQIMEVSLPQRLQLLGEIVPQDSPTLKEERFAAWPIIDLWQWVIRDALLIQCQADAFLVNNFIKEKIIELSRRFTTRRLISFLRNLDTMKTVLMQNIQPRLVFEFFVLHL